MSLLQNSNAISDSSYNIANSLRFQSASTQYLSRTPTVVGNQQKFTWSTWVKRGALTSGYQVLFMAGNSITDATFSIAFNLTDNLTVRGYNTTFLSTTQVFRDPSAWYHIVVAVDTTQATSSNRIKLYVNGSEVTAVTRSDPSLNYQFFTNYTVIHTMGYQSYSWGFNYFDGYIAETVMVDGQALTPSSFGETDITTGQWVAKKYTGTYGTNGFYLPFSNGTSTTTLGADSSGNGNNWTLTNFTRSAGVSDCWMYDVPSGNGSSVGGTQPNSNYAVLNPLASGSAPARANLGFNGAATGTRGSVAFPSSGLFYAELTLGSTASNTTAIGFGLVTSTVATNSILYAVSNAWGIYGVNATYLTRNGSVSAALGYTMTNGDVYQLAVDLANGRAWLGKNNAWYDGTTGTTGNPAAGTNPTFTSLPSELFLALYGDSGQVFNINFGQRSFAYTPPSGFRALCTANLPAATIKKGNTVFDAKLWSGNGTARSITGYGFSPDFVWIKGRSTATLNMLCDAVRGVNKQLASDATNAEFTYTDQLTAFNSDGFSLGVDTSTGWCNYNDGRTYVGWAWDAGSSTVSNSSGTIASQVRANPTAGVSVVTYTGTGANATVGHGLGVAPKMVIVKTRTNVVGDWMTWHTSLTSGAYYLKLNATNAQASAAGVWNSTTPTSTVFSVGTDQSTNFNSSTTYVAYCFAEIAGFSKFGSYTGNGSADGPFVYTGFRPKYVMWKRTDAAESWVIEDTSRNTYNVANAKLYAQDPSAEDTNATYGLLDILSNGFKCRTAHGQQNASGGTYIYMAFAESPFSSSNSR